MAKGRKHIPSPLNDLRGDPGKRRGIGTEAQFDGNPVRPAWLKGEGLELWKAIVADLETLGVATRPDGHALAGMCRWWGKWRRLEDALEKIEASEMASARPLAMMAREAWQEFAKMAVQFALTPSARAALKIAKPVKDELEIYNEGNEGAA